ncbi:MAG: hypothetical protein K5929_01120 [Lachnospiraceae bacterium]|nr:hypothetical protein [Lachnospiraceae bacterium]
MKKKKRSRNSQSAAGVRSEDLNVAEQHNTEVETGIKAGSDPDRVHEKKTRAVGAAGYEFETDFTGDEPTPIKDDLDLFFDGQEKEKVEKTPDERYETDSLFSVRQSDYGIEDLKNLWMQKNSLLCQSIATNEKHLLFVKKKIENMKFSVKFHVSLFVVCIALNAFLWFMKEAIWPMFQPTYIGVMLFLTGVVAFYNVFATSKSISDYRFHVVRNAGWTKPHVADPFHKKSPGRERNIRAEYEKINWILRQYDYEKELMFVIKMHIDSGEMTDIDELRRQLRDVMIFEEVIPAIR